MINNQIEFNKEYSKEIKEIEIEYEDFEGQILIIETYPELEKLYLRDVESIEKLNLKKLPQLQECTIWNCGTKELIIENCSQIKKLNVRSSLLTNLEFLKNLPKLEELDLDGNTKLTELLNPYKGNWKAWKAVQKLTELAKQNPQELAKKLWDLQEEVKKLKETQPITINNTTDFEKKYQELKKKLASLVEIKTQELGKITTVELVEEVSKLRKSKEGFEQVYQKIKEKENELEKLKSTYLEKPGTKKEKCKIELDKLLKKMAQPNDSDFAEIIEEKKGYLLKKVVNSSQELDKICSLKKTIIELQDNFSKREKQITQIINNYFQSIVGVEGDVKIGGNFSPQASQQAEKYIAQQLIQKNYHA